MAVSRIQVYEALLLAFLLVGVTAGPALLATGVRIAAAARTFLGADRIDAYNADVEAYHTTAAEKDFSGFFVHATCGASFGCYVGRVFGTPPLGLPLFTVTTTTFAPVTAAVVIADNQTAVRPTTSTYIEAMENFGSSRSRMSPINYVLSNLTDFSASIPWTRDVAVNMTCTAANCTRGCSTGSYACSHAVMAAECASERFSGSPAAGTFTARLTDQTHCWPGSVCGVCAWREYLHTHCVVIGRVPGSSATYRRHPTANTCFYPFKEHLFSKTAVARVTFQIRKESDPFVLAQNYTKQRNLPDFGIDRSLEHRSLGTCLTGIGGGVLGGCLAVAALLGRLAHVFRCRPMADPSSSEDSANDDSDPSNSDNDY